MPRGHPDWSPIVATSITEIRDFAFSPSTSVAVNTTLWAPAAGKRIRLLAWNLVVMWVTAATTNSYHELDVILREGITTKVLVRRLVAHQMLAGNNQSTVDDPGLETLPGGGWPLPVDEPLVLRTIPNASVPADSGGRIRGAMYGLEE